MLIIHVPGHPNSRFSYYLAEILRSEGFADLQATTLEQLTADMLLLHDLIVLPRSALTWEQIDLLSAYVAGGGVLLAFQPDTQLVRRFGLEPAFGGSVGARMRINTQLPPLSGLCDEPVDVVVPTVQWKLNGTSQVTTLAALTEPSSEFGDIAAAVIVQHEQGKALLFAYDLPHAVMRLRQGDPGNADLALSFCDDANRPNELFVGQLDPGQLHLPQADVHTAFLARLIDAIAPRPRLWYYPIPAQQSAVIMTSDEDWSTLEQWQSLIAGLRQRKAQCTFFMVANSRIEKRWVDQWEDEGHVFSVHPAHPSDYQRDVRKPSNRQLAMAEMLASNVARHKEEYKRPVNTIRQHCVRWKGYVECAQIEAALGVAMDCNYMAVKPFYVGFMAGSGRALPFVDVDGSIVPCYQLSAQWSEECLIHDTMYVSLKWPAQKAIDVTTKLVAEAATRFYTPICFNSHPVSYHTYSSPLTDGAWDKAVELGVPIVSADAWLGWTQARDGVELHANATGYLLTSAKSIPSLTILLPPGLAAETAGASQQTVSLWGQAYTALTITNITPATQIQLQTVVTIA